MSSEQIIQTDVLVIGGGIAGCFAAINAKSYGLDVLLVDKACAGKSGASSAADRAFMVSNPEWGIDLDKCLEEFNVRCEYINNRDWDEIVLNESVSIYQDLRSWGVKFARDALSYINEWPPFGNLRIIHREIPMVLRNQAEKTGVKVVDRIMVVELIKRSDDVVGALGFSLDDGSLYVLLAKATILAGGGSSFKPPGYGMAMLTGDAEAMAYRAGAEITGKEFSDSHYTWAQYPAWDVHRAADAAFPYFVDSEGNRVGIGSLLGWETNLSMEFTIHMGKGPIFWNLDAATDEDVLRMKQRQADVHNPIQYERIGYDLNQRGKILCVGGANAGYSAPHTAGIWIIDNVCSTNLQGLYAAGDCAGTRINGSYYPNPGLGTCPAAVTGRRAGKGAADYILQQYKQKKLPSMKLNEFEKFKNLIYAPLHRSGGYNPRWIIQLVQNTMMPYFILFIKNEERLKSALTTIEFIRDHFIPRLRAEDIHELRLAHEVRNMVLIAEMILKFSLFRTESRGLHYREDYPKRDDPNWLAWIKAREENGEMKLLKEPVPRKWWPDLSTPYKNRYPLRFPGELVK